MKKSLLTGLLVLITIIGGIIILRFFSPEDNWVCQNGEWIKHGSPSALKPTELCENKSGENNFLRINFDESGNIVKNDSDSWRLIYEKPGAPALSVDLNFDNLSKCNKDNEEKNCDTAILNIGDRVEIKGIKEENSNNVKIINLIFI